MIASKFMSFYKNCNIILKILLFVIVPIMCILWIIGSLTYWDRLIMFLVGIIAGTVLMYFVQPYVVQYIQHIIDFFEMLKTLY